MPGFDGSGPSGRGPMTGGGRGYCNPASLKDHSQVVVSALTMVEAGDTGIFIGKPVCPVGHEDGRIGRAHIASHTIRGKTKSECSKKKPMHSKLT
jgi:hypothetical protein